jgi:hypothetical protein
MVLLAGCVAPDPRPFQQYAVGVKQAGDALDQVLVQDIGWSRDKYIDSVLDGSVALRDTAILDRKSPFTVTFPAPGGVNTQPTFYKLQDVRVTLLALNDATEKYINVLATLASSDLVNPATFDAMAKDADASLNSITKQLDARVPGTAIHVFSVSSAEIARLVIEHKRHRALVKVLTESQAGVDGYCERCLALLTILDQSLATDYSAKADTLEGAFSKIPKAARAADPKARAAVEQLLQLNSDYLALVHSLQSAKTIYKALPQGHSELLKSVQKQPTGFEAIKLLYQEGIHLKSIYDELIKPTATKG